VVELRRGAVSTYDVTPADFGLSPVPFDQIASSPTAEGNALRVREVLEGDYESPAADFFCMNAAAALHIAGHAASYLAGFGQAKTALAEGKALEKLTQLTSCQGHA
jgi:anthranilate phosphoribosyltransferase